MLPPTYPDTTTSSEAEVFRLIRDAEGSREFTCFHSVGIAQHQRKDYAETDFVLLTPRGLFCIEVKGGEVHREGGVWRIGWPSKNYVSAEGPFKQAQSARWALIDYLSKRLGQDIRRSAVIGWGVAFPDIEFNYQDPEWSREVIFDQRDKLTSFANYVERLERYSEQRLTDTGRAIPGTLNLNVRQQIIDALRTDFDVVPTLRGLLIESERELVGLSAEQTRLLDYALNDSNPRLLCDGGPGTGKTLIAVEAARRLAQSGSKVLFLCFNDNLRQYLRLEFGDAESRVRVITVHSLFDEIINQAGLRGELQSARKDDDDFFENVYPSVFESACATLLDEGSLPQFDVAIIDEAQDVLNGDIASGIELVLAGGFARGRWLVFYDSGLQSSIYGRSDVRVFERLKSFGAAYFPLSENFRNPKPIVSEACELTGIPVPICRRTLMSPVDYRIVVDERDEGKKVRALLLELMREGIMPDQVTILSARSASESCVAKFSLDVGKPIHVLQRASGPRPPGAFTLASIAGFKGLENDIIILTDLPLALTSERSRADVYVGMTRARTKLFAMVNQEFLDARLSS
jgi:DNA polymerase III delta prime subunit